MAAKPFANGQLGPIALSLALPRGRPEAAPRFAPSAQPAAFAHVIYGRTSFERVVVRKVKDPSRQAADAATVKRALESLRGRIPGLVAIEVGVDIGHDAGAGDVCLYAEFADRGALGVCRNHPPHLDGKAAIAPLPAGRRVVDRET